ncbi:MAG: type II toxin-antitoxin system Phd/YefM family antitoxin [Hallerella porci]|uniref:Antitoxin n=1 Tax=Hallerella porci TaxID=1945871 RepID=A0ABX5LPY2_9BACT|nr:MULTISPECIES: type II toxin-antitoxin system Phd/YefM family antitoxin [Hallerella]MCI5600044.1 type II toxin-antitoxin system Phd/YefM family antitoxin [Hallerella sp.]MDY3921081.1 type II toxin-antitoxin system Phd/YefM family antitoxin [Hallerella porci]PWL04022.1 prevent-host-death family protein [Hallerella porci]
MAKIVSAMEARKGFGDLLNQVALKGEDIVIERAGKPLAKLSPVSSNGSQKLDFRDISRLPADIW